MIVLFLKLDPHYQVFADCHCGKPSTDVDLASADGVPRKIAQRCQFQPLTPKRVLVVHNPPQQTLCDSVKAIGRKPIVGMRLYLGTSLERSQGCVTSGPTGGLLPIAGAMDRPTSSSIVANRY